jgi:hypothetical protein
MGISTFLWKDGEVGITGGTLQVLSAAFWAMGLLGMFNLVRETMPRYAVIGSLVAIYACIGASNFGMDGIFREAYQIAGAGTISVDAFRSSLGLALPLTLLVPGLAFPLSLLVLGIVLIRKDVIPAWCGILFSIGGLSFPMGRIPRIEAIAHGTDLLLFVSAAWIGWHYLRGEASSARLRPGFSTTS